MGRSAIHPGEHLAEQLEELHMSAAELARQLKTPTNRITEILKGRRAVTGDTALRLGHFFGTSPEFWMNLQKNLRASPGRGKIRRNDQGPADSRQADEKTWRGVAAAARVTEHLGQTVYMEGPRSGIGSGAGVAGSCLFQKSKGQGRLNRPALSNQNQP